MCQKNWCFMLLPTLGQVNLWPPTFHLSPPWGNPGAICSFYFFPLGGAINSRLFPPQRNLGVRGARQ